MIFDRFYSKMPRYRAHKNPSPLEYDAYSKNIASLGLRARPRWIQMTNRLLESAALKFGTFDELPHSESPAGICREKSSFRSHTLSFRTWNKSETLSAHLRGRCASRRILRFNSDQSVLDETGCGVNAPTRRGKKDAFVRTSCTSAERRFAIFFSFRCSMRPLTCRST